MRLMKVVIWDFNYTYLSLSSEGAIYLLASPLKKGNFGLNTSLAYQVGFISQISFGCGTTSLAYLNQLIWQGMLKGVEFSGSLCLNKLKPFSTIIRFMLNGVTLLCTKTKLWSKACKHFDTSFKDCMRHNKIILCSLWYKY